MLRKKEFSPKYLLAIFVSIFVYGFLVSTVFCQDRVVKGKLDVPFDTGFFSDEPDDSSKAKALEKAKLAAWKKYTSGLSTARAKIYAKVKKCPRNRRMKKINTLILLKSMVKRI